MSAPTTTASTAASIPALPAAEQHVGVAALVELITRAEGPALDAFLELANTALRSQPADVPKVEKAALMRLVVHLQRRKEEAELAADPARRAGIERVAEHFARKAQAGFSPHPLPE